MTTVAEAQTIVLDVTDLAAQHVIGNSCCAVPAAEAVRAVLTEWRGVSGVRVDQAGGRVEVEVAGEGPAADELVWSLRMLGLGAAVTMGSGAPDVMARSGRS